MLWCGAQLSPWHWTAPSGLTSATESLLSHCHSYYRGTYFWWLTDAAVSRPSHLSPTQDSLQVHFSSIVPCGVGWGTLGPALTLGFSFCPTPLLSPLCYRGWPPGIAKKTTWHTKLRLRVNPWVGRPVTSSNWWLLALFLLLLTNVNLNHLALGGSRNQYSLMGL